MTRVFLLCLTLVSSQACQESSQKANMIPENFDWQGHRGCRGILPENSIPGFLKALEYPIKTLELDIVVSGDSQLVVSHEPWFSHHICSKPDGSEVVQDEAMQLSLYKMPYDLIREFDCGSRGNERFPEQVKLQTYKPRLLDMIGTVETYCEDNNRTKPYYNIEIKSDPRGYDTMFPQPKEFVALVLKELAKVQLQGRVTIQSFDVNVMEELKAQEAPYQLAFLVESQNDGLEANLNLLTFKPDIYSPNYKLISKNDVERLHEMDILVIPWTVNEVKDMNDLIKIGVDGIITDYPNRIEKVGKEKI